MTDFEKTVIGFFVAWSIVVPILWFWTNTTLEVIDTKLWGIRDNTEIPTPRWNYDRYTNSYWWGFA